MQHYGFLLYKFVTNICHEEHRRLDRSNGHRHHLEWLVSAAVIGDGSCKL